MKENENLEKKNEKVVDAVHCEAVVEEHPTRVIIDSGSVSNVASARFLKQINRRIDRPSNISLIGINGKPERPLGEVKDLNIKIGELNQQVDALVMEKAEYDLLLGNQ